MKPFRTFLSLIRPWHVLVPLAVSIALALVALVTGPPIAGIAVWLFLLITPPLLCFGVAYLGYVAAGRHERAAKLFPSVFLVTMAVMTLPWIELIRSGQDVSVGVVVVLTIIAALAFSAMFLAARPLFPKRRS